VEHSKYLGTTLKIQIFIHDAIKSRFKAENACYHSVQKPSKNIKLRTYRTTTLRVVSCGCKGWSLTLREEYTLRVFDNRGLRSIFGPKRSEVTGSGENYITRSFMLCTPHQISFE
jgi:hypothetical protein